MKNRRVLSGLLAVMMLFSMVPSTAFAQNAEKNQKQTQADSSVGTESASRAWDRVETDPEKAKEPEVGKKGWEFRVQGELREDIPASKASKIQGGGICRSQADLRK